MRYLLKTFVLAGVGVVSLALVSAASAACPNTTAANAQATAPAAVAQKQGEVRSYSYQPSTQSTRVYSNRGRSSGNSGGFDALAPLRAKGVIR